MEKRLIYRSQPFGFDEAMLAGILSAARRNNPRDGITGALICRSDIYLQMIEGPSASIDALFKHIKTDDRHANVRLLLEEEASERMFPDWAMLDDQAPSMFWTTAEIDSGAIEAASPAELLAPFAKLNRKAAN